MNFKLLLKGLVLSLVITFVFAGEYTGDCKEIYDNLKKKGYELDLGSCDVNKEGKVTRINLYTYCLTDEDVNQLISYKTITSLEFNLILHYHYTELYNLMKCQELQNFPSAIKNLNNLETLDLTGYMNLKKNDLASIPKSVKNLVIGKSDLTQDIVNELGTLTNLQSIHFYRTI